MSTDLAPGQVRAWLDDAVLEVVEQVPDETAAFNYRAVYAGMPVHVVKPGPGSPIIVGGQVAIQEGLRPSFRNLSAFDRRQLRARIREQLTGSPSLYYFLDSHGANVPFEEVEQIRIERYIYPDGASQHTLMNALFAVAKQLFYLQESIATLVENVESRR